MKNLINNIKQLQLKQVIAFLVAGFFLIVTTACSSPKSPNISNNAEGKAKSLIEQSQANLNKNDEPGDFVENIKAGVSVFPEDLDESVKQNVEDFAEGTQRGFDNFKANTKDAAKNVKRAAEDVSDTAQQKAQAASKTTQRAVEDAVDVVSGEG